MKTTRKEFMGDGAAFAATSHFFPALAMMGRKKETIKIRQIRNATLRVRFGGVEFLIDPWLAGKSEGMTFRKGPFASEVVDSAQLDIVMPMSKASAAPRQTPRSSRATWTRSPMPRSRARRFAPRLNGAGLPVAS